MCLSVRPQYHFRTINLLRIDVFCQNGQTFSGEVRSSTTLRIINLVPLSDWLPHNTSAQNCYMFTKLGYIRLILYILQVKFQARLSFY